MKFPEVFVGERKPWKGILLYGVHLNQLSLQGRGRLSWPKLAFPNKKMGPSLAFQLRI